MRVTMTLNMYSVLVGERSLPGSHPTPHVGMSLRKDLMGAKPKGSTFRRCDLTSDDSKKELKEVLEALANILPSLICGGCEVMTCRGLLRTTNTLLLELQ